MGGDKKEDGKEKKDPTKDFIDSIKNLAGLGKRPPDAELFDFHFEGKNKGKVWLSFEILPQKAALAKPAGFGRSAPNNPTLPPPTGRINWLKMFNPLYFLKTLVGPEKYRKCLCCCCIVLIVALLCVAGPYIIVIKDLGELLPVPLIVIIGILIGILVLWC